MSDVTDKGTDKGSSTPDGKKGNPITQEQFDGVFAEMKEAREQAKQLKTRLAEIDSQQKAAEEKRLKDQGEWQKIAESAKQETETMKKRFRDVAVMSALKTEAIQHGIIDPDLVGLIDVSDIKVGEDGRVEGVQERLKEFKKLKPHVFKDGIKTPVAPISQAAPGAPQPAQGFADELKAAKTSAEIDEVYKKHGIQRNLGPMTFAKRRKLGG